MKKIIFLTPLDAEYGFRLTGAEQYAVDVKDVEGLIKKLMADPDKYLKKQMRFYMPGTEVQWPGQQ